MTSDWHFRGDPDLPGRGKVLVQRGMSSGIWTVLLLIVDVAFANYCREIATGSLHGDGQIVKTRQFSLTLPVVRPKTFSGAYRLDL